MGSLFLFSFFIVALGSPVDRVASTSPALIARAGTSKFPNDPCADHLSVGWNGVWRTDCAKGNTMNNGICGDPVSNQKRCTAYCEEKRSGVIGREQAGPGDAVARGQENGLEHSLTYTVEHSISFDIQGGWRDAVVASVGYSYTWGTATGTTTTIKGEVTNDYWSSWVFFPVFILTCGIISEAMSAGPPDDRFKISWIDYGCIPPSIAPIRTHHICDATPMLNEDKQPVVLWALRYYEDKKDGSPMRPAPMNKQPQAYREICQRAGGYDMDGGEYECSVPWEAPEPKEPETKEPKAEEPNTDGPKPTGGPKPHGNPTYVNQCLGC